MCKTEFFLFIEKWTLLLLCMQCSFNVAADVQKISADEILISKNLNAGDFEEFSRQFNATVKTIHMKDCYGGVVLDSIKIGKIIFDHKLQTKLSGVTGSACSTVFLSGAKRTLDTKYGGAHVVMVHGAKYLDSGNFVSLEVNDRLLKRWRRDLDIKFSETINEIIRHTKDKNEGAYFVSNPFKGINKAYHCKSRATINYENCAELKGIDMTTERIITE